MHRSGGASHDDTWSLPGDTEEEVGDRDLFAPSEPVDLPPDQPYMEIGAGADTKPSAAALPDTTAASANAAPVAAPAPQARPKSRPPTARATSCPRPSPRTTFPQVPPATGPALRLRSC
ncbi:hypothetical protein [Paracoccus cavernae]|uniref:hypothetical protein n=1 Tax=Paracoccus cavernae TaxID=1571207 RepID=UPI003640115F